MTQILSHMYSAETESQLGKTFIYKIVFEHRLVTENGGKAHLCSSTHAVLTISASSTLSFCSGALTNIPH